MRKPLEKELKSYREQGISLYLNGILSNPKTIAKACQIAEGGGYMRDYVEDESWGGDKWKQSQHAASDGGKTLQKSGQLAASITSRAGTDFARIGSNKKYAAIHHLGGQAGRGKKLTLPARPYLPISGKGKLQRGAEDNILDIALKALSKGV